MRCISLLTCGCVPLWEFLGPRLAQRRADDEVAAAEADSERAARRARMRALVSARRSASWGASGDAQAPPAADSKLPPRPPAVEKPAGHGGASGPGPSDLRLPLSTAAVVPPTRVAVDFDAAVPPR